MTGLFGVQNYQVVPQLETRLPPHEALENIREPIELHLAEDAIQLAPGTITREISIG